jgi:hypothetical protein
MYLDRCRVQKSSSLNRWIHGFSLQVLDRRVLEVVVHALTAAFHTLAAMRLRVAWHKACETRGSGRLRTYFKSEDVIGIEAPLATDEGIVCIVSVVKFLNSSASYPSLPLSRSRACGKPVHDFISATLMRVTFTGT